ncbi:hypothetical protein H5183_20800 [Pseudoalteromonas sp. SR44-8]|uniref:hypothetical protein n=1 Tax=Pseudoalteromonas sp. SR44-8 TaxID=2760933 RepID=UPI001602CFE8|nr:hypothetical protein [Pseudoalteromonas sp. SR44-8]MBB1303743.1 hypothetical protein [Pseudoalteromonas sp. SR44-8]
MRLVFYYPSRGIGGAQVLFQRVCIELSNLDYKVAIISNKDCFLYQNLIQKGTNVGFIDIDNISLSPDDVLVLSLDKAFQMKELNRINGNPRLVFWDLHPFNLVQWTLFSLFYKKYPLSFFVKILKRFEHKRISKIKRFLEVANDSGALFFMCQNNYRFNAKMFNVNFNPTYFPVAISEKYEGDLESVIPSKESIIRICWISRLAVDKVKVLNQLISDIESSNCSSLNRIVLHIVGSGDAEHNIQKSKKIKIKMHGVLKGNDLTSHIRGMDLGFSMGMSALEFAINCIPSILVPSSAATQMDLKRDNKYMFLYDIEGYDVAVENYYSNDKRLKFQDVLLRIEKNKHLHAKKCYDYVLSSHLTPSVVKNMVRKIGSSSFYLNDFNKLNIEESTRLERVTLIVKKLIKNALEYKNK